MPKRTYQPKRRKRVKTHGYRARAKTNTGRAILKRRKTKKRTKLSVSQERRGKKQTFLPQAYALGKKVYFFYTKDIC